MLVYKSLSVKKKQVHCTVCNRSQETILFNDLFVLSKRYCTNVCSTRAFAGKGNVGNSNTKRTQTMATAKVV